MSNTNNPIKVGRTALRRVQKGWTKGSWSKPSDDGKTHLVCMEGAIYGYCKPNQHKKPTVAQMTFARTVREIIMERSGKKRPGFGSITGFNDYPTTSQEDVEEVFKLAIIRLETGGDGNDELDEDEITDLLSFVDS